MSHQKGAKRKLRGTRVPRTAEHSKTFRLISLNFGVFDPLHHQDMGDMFFGVGGALFGVAEGAVKAGGAELGGDDCGFRAEQGDAAFRFNQKDYPTAEIIDLR